MQSIKPVQKCAKYELKPVQYAQDIIFCTPIGTIFCYFEINGYFHFFLIIYLFIYFFFFGGGGGCGGGDIGRCY